MTETTNESNGRTSALVAALATVCLFILLGGIALAVYDLNHEFLRGVGATIAAGIAAWLIIDYRHGAGR